MQKKRVASLCLLVLILVFSYTGCGSAPGGQSIPIPQTPSSSGKTDPASSEKGSRDNTPVVLVPTASGSEVYSCDVASIDASNTAEGYFVASYTGNNEKVKMQVTGPDGNTYTYNMHGGEEVFPLPSGNGAYKVAVYESADISSNKYTMAFSQDLSVNITNEFGPYLYPSQYVNFHDGSLAIEEGKNQAYSANSDLDVVTNVYNYIISNYSYDYDKAATVASGYLPIVDDFYKSKTGICFDYAVLMATMLRTQRIPTRLEIGYVGEEYHAWISVHTPETGWINGLIEFDGTAWKLMDPTFAATSGKPKSFTADSASYLIKYVY